MLHTYSIRVLLDLYYRERATLLHERVDSTGYEWVRIPETMNTWILNDKYSRCILKVFQIIEIDFTTIEEWFS